MYAAMEIGPVVLEELHQLVVVDARAFWQTNLDRFRNSLRKGCRPGCVCSRGPS